MPKVTISRDGTIEADLTLEEIKELVSSNGHRRPSPIAIRQRTDPGVEHPSDYVAFYKALSDKGRKFFDVLMLNNGGISAESLAPKLDFKNANQIGGLTGGGIAKVAKRHSIQMSDLYRSEVKVVDGKNVRTFYPGKLVLERQQKPAV
jgi:hypothetical protein